MGKYFLAIDIGASSGRHILGSLENGKIVLEEIHRFWNGMDDINGTLCWDVDRLFHEIIEGMKKCREIGKIPVSVGIDTWGVDYVLLDKDDKILGQAVGYRDHRTDGMDEEVYRIISEEDLYARTGIQKQIFNTVYQLMAVKKQNPEYLEKAAALLMIPDYFHYRLCGKKVQEYTNATTGQLVNPTTRDWDYELIEMLGFNKDMFQKMEMPGAAIGRLTEEVKNVVGYDCQVVLPPTHDTASAVMAVPSNDKNVCYISSGTWSLMGVERDDADCSPKSRTANFTNEGGYEGRITYLANIMGLWMIQSVRNQLAPDMSYGELCEQASKETIQTLVDCQDESFLSPDDMVEAVKEYCRKASLTVPETLPQLASVIYNSLAKCYAEKLQEIENLTGKKYDRIHIIGGGSNAVYLNELTAKYTGVPVHAGPGEATAIGNLLTQMIQDGEFSDLTQARKCVADSFEIKIYQ
ncbi:MAG: rhamnulokinase [Bacillus sp. (in: Bacteria)]|nr:rhamnulokinase [Bacillus sp. (in: firmicutes)]MCM1427508.1 rhamnulokinase [Eubacterium sp.]